MPRRGRTRCLQHVPSSIAPRTRVASFLEPHHEIQSGNRDQAPRAERPCTAPPTKTAQSETNYLAHPRTQHSVRHPEKKSIPPGPNHPHPRRASTFTIKSKSRSATHRGQTYLKRPAPEQIESTIVARPTEKEESLQSQRGIRTRNIRRRKNA